MKAIVALPPLRDFYFTPHRFSCLGGQRVALILKAAGIDTEFYSFPSMVPTGSTIPLPAHLDYLKSFIVSNETGPITYFTKYQRFGQNFNFCAEKISAANPDTCFISCFAWAYAQDTIDLADAIKKNSPNLRIVIGGAGASAYPGYFLRQPAIDFVLTGEAETNLLSFVNAVNTGTLNDRIIPGLYRRDGKAILCDAAAVETISADLSCVFVKTRENATSVNFSTMLSRGCPKQCRFCSNHLCHGRTFRTTDLAAVEDAINNLSRDTAIMNRRVSINFEDDNILVDPEYFRKVISLIHKSFPNVQFLTENGIDYTMLDGTLCNWLIESGMKQFNLSLGAIDPEAFAREKRVVMLDTYEEVLAILSQHNIPSITYFICGLKTDTRESVARVIRYLTGKDTLIGISLFYAVPGLDDFTDPAFFDNHSPALCAGSSAYPWNRSLDTATLITAFRLCRYANLTKKKDPSGEDLALIRLVKKERKLYTVVKRGKDRRITAVENMDNELIEKVLGE